MNVTLCIPTLNRYDLLQEAIASARAGTRPPDRVVVIDNGHDCPFLEGVELVRFGYNLGVAGSWNWFLDHIPDWLIISNDDVRFHPDTIAKLIEAAVAQPEQIFFCPLSGASKNDGMPRSLFLQRKRSLEIVGHYDEQFWPSYFEDGDYAHRMRLVGQHENHAECAYDHVLSGTLKAMSEAQRKQHHIRFDSNQKRYQTKWGGLPPDGEKYRTPFNQGGLP